VEERRLNRKDGRRNKGRWREANQEKNGGRREVDKCRKKGRTEGGGGEQEERLA
jgi:hypothetical protein